MELFYKLQLKNGKRTQTADSKDVNAPPKKQLIVDSSACSVTEETLPMDDVSDDISEHSFDDLSDAEEALDVADELPPEPEKCEDCTENDTLDTLIAEEYTEVETLPHLPAIDVKLANILTTWLHTLPSREKVKQLFMKCMLPCNVDGLRPVKINLLVYEKPKPSFKVNDQHLKGINMFFARGLGPLAAMWDKILKWEARLQGIDVTVVCHSGVMKLDDLMLDFTDLHRQFDASLCLLCTGHCVVLDKR